MLDEPALIVSRHCDSDITYPGSSGGSAAKGELPADRGRAVPRSSVILRLGSSPRDATPRMKDAGRTNRPASSSHFEVFDRQFVPIVMAWPLEAAKRAESTGRVPAEREPARRSSPSSRERRPAAKCPKATDDAGSTHQTRHRPPGSHSPERLQEGWAAAVPAATSEAERPRGPAKPHGPGLPVANS